MLCLYINYRKESKVVPLAKAQGLHRTALGPVLPGLCIPWDTTAREMMVVTNRRRDKMARN